MVEDGEDVVDDDIWDDETLDMELEYADEEAVVVTVVAFETSPR